MPKKRPGTDDNGVSGSVRLLGAGESLPPGVVTFGDMRLLIVETALCVGMLLKGEGLTEEKRQLALQKLHEKLVGAGQDGLL